MLLDGLNHVAVLTQDTDRFQEFYVGVFGAKVLSDGLEGPPDRKARMSVVEIGPHTELNVFEVPGNTEAEHQVPMFGRGRLDHFALHAANLEAFETLRDRLISRGAADDFVTDFGMILSMFFRDPDGLECELCTANPDWDGTASNPPGTRAARYPEQ